MALIKCKECGSEVSDKAETCPKCGVSEPALDWKKILNPPIDGIKGQIKSHHLPSRGTDIKGNNILKLVLLGILLIVIVTNFSDNNSSSSSSSLRQAPAPSSSSNSSASGMTQAECEIQRTEFYANCGDGIFNPIECSDRLKCWKQGNHWRMSKNGADFL